MNSKEARNLGLSNVLDVSEGGRAPMMANAINLLMQARAMSRPTDEDLKRYGVDRPGFESLLSEIAANNASNDPSKNLNVSSTKARPGLRALGYGLAAAIPAGIGSHLIGNSLMGSLGVGLLSGGMGAAFGGMSAAEKNKKLLATANALRDHGILTRGSLSKAMPILSDKTAAEKCDCCGKTPCECSENCSCGCKSKSAAAKPGLWANIHAKKERGEAPAKPGNKDYPTAKNWKKVTNESEKKALFGFGAKKKPGMTIEEASKLIDPMLLARAAMINELFEASKDPTGKAVKQKFRNPKFRQSFFEGMTPEMYDAVSVVNEKKALFGFGGSKPQQPKPLTPKEIAQFAAEDDQDAAEEEHYNKKMEFLKNLQKNKTQENIHNYLSHWMKVPGATNPNVKHDSFWDPSDSLETLVEDLPWAKKDLKSPYFQEDLSELMYSPLTQSFKTDEDKAKAINEVASRFFPHIPKQVVKKASPAWQTSEGKSESGGLNDKGRASLKAQGHDIKRPQPEGGPRKDSFCARMKGMKSKLTSSETARDPDSRINKSLRKWKCGSAVEKLAFLMKTAKCWQGYERVPGTKAMTPGSCRPVPNKAPNSTETKQPEVKKAAMDKKKDKEPERKSWTKPLVIGGGLLGSALLGAAAMAGRRVASPGTGGVMTRRAIIESVKHLVNDKTKQDTSNQYYSKMGY